MAYRFDCSESGGRRRGIERAAVSVTSGELVVLPVDSAYGIGCDAFSADAVGRLRSLKGHSRRQPPPVLIGHTRTLVGIATALSDAAHDLAAAFWPGPLTLICQAQPTLDWDLGDTGGHVSVRVPLHPVALQLLDATGPMAVTAANPAGDPTPPQACQDVHLAFGDAVEVYLDVGHLTRPRPSSIVDVTGERPVLLRAGALSADDLRAVVADLDVVATG